MKQLLEISKMVRWPEMNETLVSWHGFSVVFESILKFLKSFRHDVFRILGKPYHLMSAPWWGEVKRRTSNYVTFVNAHARLCDYPSSSLGCGQH